MRNGKENMRKTLSLIVLFALIILGLTGYGYSQNWNEELAMNHKIGTKDLALNKPVTVNSGIGGERVNDGKDDTSYRALKRKNVEIEIDLEEEMRIDTVVLKESGLNVSDFEIQVFTEEGGWARVYRQEKIEPYRLATFKPVSAEKVKVIIKDSQALPALKTIEVYNLGKVKNDDFKVTAYISMGHLYDKLADGDLSDEELGELFGTDYYDLYTDVFLIFDVAWDENAEIVFKEGEENFANGINSLKKVIGERDVNIFVTVLNPHDNGIVLDTITNKKETLLTNMIAFANKYELDGIDLDWEFPFSQEEYDAYNVFLQELKVRLVTEVGADTQLSLALATWALLYEPETIAIIDQIQVMGYDILDQDGQHASFYGGAVQPVQYLLDQGFSKEQLNVGVPFYGTYIEGRMEQYLYYNLDDIDYSKNLYNMPGRGPVYFNSPQMIKDKTAYALYNGYGGVMVFSLYCDIDMNEEYSLSKSIADTLAERREQ